MRLKHKDHTKGLKIKEKLFEMQGTYLYVCVGGCLCVST